MLKPLLRRISIALTLALLLLGPCYGFEFRVPEGQPTQIRSQVNYDPNLSDQFFESNLWSCPMDVEECEEKSRIKNTARCFTSFQYERFIKFCSAKLLDGDTVQLFIYDHADRLRIVVQNGAFWSQYRYAYKAFTPLDEGLRWTTKQQELTLDKQVYRKGDIIKGRIVFECAEEVNQPLPGAKFPKTIKIEGVFKTVLE